MKKSVRKLGLHRETLRHLQSGALRDAQGAGVAQSNWTSCECEWPSGCACDSTPFYTCDSCNC
jgi:hypothetical protein